MKQQSCEGPGKRIHLSPPHLDGREKDMAIEALASNWITTMGPQVDLFEKEMCARTGIAHAVALASGTSALHLALLNLDVRPGEEVLCSDLTFVAAANAIMYCGAIPVFIDAERRSWNMDPDLLEAELAGSVRRGRMPRAVIVVDLYGQCADWDRIQAIADRFGVPIIEDAAEALGATHGGRSAGSFGRMGVFSFNGNKIITTSGGGMLLSSNAKLIERARHLAAQARDKAPHYQHSKIGFNYRLSNILAAIGRGQLEKLDQKVARKREINRFYRQALAGLPGIGFLPEAPYGSSNNWLTVIQLDPKESGVDRERVRLALAAENIEARPVWKPMHLQPLFKDCRACGGGVGAELFARGLCLPSGTQLGEADLERIVAVVRNCVERA